MLVVRYSLSVLCIAVSCYGPKCYKVFSVVSVYECGIICEVVLIYFLSFTHNHGHCCSFPLESCEIQCCFLYVS